MGNLRAQSPIVSRFEATVTKHRLLICKVIRLEHAPAEYNSDCKQLKYLHCVGHRKDGRIVADNCPREFCQLYFIHWRPTFIRYWRRGWGSTIVRHAQPVLLWYFRAKENTLVARTRDPISDLEPVFPDESFGVAEELQRRISFRH